MIKKYDLEDRTNEAFGKKEFAHRMRIARKEGKESFYWLELILESNESFKEDINVLLQETRELRNIFTSIIEKVK